MDKLSGQKEGVCQACLVPISIVLSPLGTAPGIPPGLAQPAAGTWKSPDFSALNKFLLMA
jgi:hypothetical protein